MTSPSVRSTSRRTPWVLGCCGPMFTSISSVRTSNSVIVGSCWTIAVLMLLIFQGFIEQSGPMNDDDDFNNVITNPINDSIVSIENLANVRILPFFHHPSGERETPETTYP